MDLRCIDILLDLECKADSVPNRQYFCSGETTTFVGFGLCGEASEAAEEQVRQRLLSLSPEEHFLYFFGILRDHERNVLQEGHSTRHRSLLGWYNLLCDSAKQDDGYSHFLLASYELALGRYEQSFESLLKCLDLMPCCFCAWEVLGAAVSHLPDINLSSRLAKIPNLQMWCPLLELYIGATWRLDSILETLEIPTAFESLCFVQLQRALLEYNRRNFVGAKAIFTKIFRSPRRRPMDGLSALSDILYLEGNETELERLQQCCELVSAEDPASLHVAGNCLSLKRDFRKAAILFKKAARCRVWHSGSSWILAGHQYIQLRQPEAAVSCYRKAVGM